MLQLTYHFIVGHKGNLEETTGAAAVCGCVSGTGPRRLALGLRSNE